MTAPNRKAHFFWSVVVVFLIQLPLLWYYATGPGSFLLLMATFLAAALIVGGLYLMLVNFLHVDRQAPLPWYGSPVVWLGIPLLLLIIYMLIP